MFNFKSKKIALPLYLCVLAALLSSPLAQAELGGSGGSAARDAAEQRAAKERKLEKRKQEAEAKKAATAQESQPAAEQQPVEKPQEKPPTE